MKAWQLIEKPENFSAHNPNCKTTHCLVTAVSTVNGDLYSVYKHLGLKAGDGLVEWAKNHTHAEVLAVLKELDI